MSRGVDARVADIRRLLAGAAAVHADRARIAPHIARCTGLTCQGVELGFQSLEQSASDDDLRTLVACSGSARHVHVILSANVFIAPLRAIVLARAAGDRVTVRPSPRDPVLTHALVEAATDGAIALVDERDLSSCGADEIHVYGRDETISAVRACMPAGAILRGHGAGLGVALVTAGTNVAAAAELLAADVVPFDQRGCLSPRIAIVEGGDMRAHSFAHSLHECLAVWGRRVPRGTLLEEERAAIVGWRETMAFAGSVWDGEDHAVSLAPMGAHLAIPPIGRHVHVMPAETMVAASARIATIARFIVAVGSDNPRRAAAIVPSHARVSKLGRMQRPRLDGPLDRRAAPFA